MTTTAIPGLPTDTVIYALNRAGAPVAVIAEPGTKPTDRRHGMVCTGCLETISRHYPLEVAREDTQNHAGKCRFLPAPSDA
ncbi:hypothetical protein [Streptomyces sp. NPDC101145]|uniref:hypothetical protein n=1 Tax=Streptomyces sp. NPDC101145 TaxID=3366112 RepID=UPI00382465C0